MDLSTIIAIVASVASISMSGYILRSTLRSHEKRSIDDLITTTIKLAIEYPHLEQNDFCENWPNVESSEEDKARYDNYCCIVFNLTERTYKHFTGEHLQMKNLLHVDELFWQHRKWWKNDPENRKGYITGFSEYVERRLTCLKKEKNEEKSHTN